MFDSLFSLKRRPPLTAHPLTRVLFSEEEAAQKTLIIIGYHDREVHFRSPGNLSLIENYIRDRWRAKLSEVQQFVGVRIHPEPSFFGEVGPHAEIVRALRLLYRETGIEISHPVSRILPAEIAFERRIVILTADPLSGDVRVATDNRAAKTWLAGQSETTNLLKNLRKLANISPDRRIQFTFLELPENQLGRLLDEAYPGHVVGVVSDKSVETFETGIKNQYAALQTSGANSDSRTKTKQEEVVETILESALNQRANDIDLNFVPLSETDGHINFRFFFGGQWRSQPPIAMPLAAYKAIMRMLFSWTGMSNPDFFGGPKEGTFKFTSSREGILNFRLAAAPDAVARFPNLEFYSCTLRLLRPTAATYKLSQIGLLPEQQEACELAAVAPFGLIVNAGRTGQGKNVTQAALIAHLRSYDPSAMVRFLVNPLEYDISGVFQTDTGFTKGGQAWTTEEYVRNILKRRPKVIAIPEVNDSDSANMAMLCSTSGHLTLVTVHAETPFSVMSRFQTYGVPVEVFTEQVRLITTQVLVPRLCPECKEPVTSQQLLAYLKDTRFRYLPLVYQHWFQSDLGGRPLEEINLFKPRVGGCSSCNGIGYRGDVGIFEVLDPVEAEIRHLMMEGVPIDKISNAAIENGHITLHAAGLSRVIDGTIDLLKFIDLADKIDPYREGVPVDLIQRFRSERGNFGRRAGYKRSPAPEQSPPSVENPSTHSSMEEDPLDVEFDVIFEDRS
jgi:type II secretory ATPase GspE/PulE/Tfp pilus assembly ATPase PilB-like protein